MDILNKGHHKKDIVRFIVIILAFQFLILPAMALPTQGDSFEYTLIRKVGSGSGEYSGYNDELRSNGKYDVLSVNSTHVQFHAGYSWTYWNTEGLNQNGTEDRIATFSLKTRRYTTKTDLDEYDKSDPSGLSVWLWIQPEVKTGDTIAILDDKFTVTGEYVTFWSGSVPKKGIELRSTGTRSRNDVYGEFTYTYTDIYYFDRSTGYIIAERYKEEDTGFWNGKHATFELTEGFDLTNSSYTVPVDYLTLIAVIIGIIVVIFLIIYAAYIYRWRARTLRIDPYGNVKIFRITSTKNFRFNKNLATKIFDPFIQDFSNKTLLSKNILAEDIAAVATNASALLGIATYNYESDIGMILCENTEVKEGLRRFIGARDFFTEVRSTIPEKIINEAAKFGEKIENRFAYNVFDTYKIVRLEKLEDTGYDTELISRMKESDLTEVELISNKVYNVRSRSWIRAQYLSGDIGFVARLEGKIVGFAFATYANGHGRIHTLTVLPEYRNQGIGKELMRARLKTLYDLGAVDVIAEIANWNLSSLQIAYNHGFKQAGTMYVETVRPQRIKRSIVRR